MGLGMVIVYLIAPDTIIVDLVPPVINLRNEVQRTIQILGIDSFSHPFMFWSGSTFK